MKPEGTYPSGPARDAAGQAGSSSGRSCWFQHSLELLLRASEPGSAALTSPGLPAFPSQRVSLSSRAQERPQAELSLQKEQLQLKIIEVEDEMDKWQKERDRIKNYTTNEKATVDQHFKELIRDLERQRDEVKAALDQREKIASENVKEIVDELEERAKLLREDKENREQIHQISDSVLFLQEFGALMRNYVPPPSLPTYSVLLEGESMSPSMGLLRDDLLNVCMRHVEKICKADLGRNFIERNHMENGDHRYMMNNYEWNQPDNLKRFSMFLSPKANFNPRSWEFSSFQATEETLVGNGTKLPFQFSSVGQTPPGDFSKQSDGSLFTKTAYPSIVRHQSTKVTPQTWKSSKQSVLQSKRNSTSSDRTRLR